MSERRARWQRRGGNEHGFRKIARIGEGSDEENGEEKDFNQQRQRLIVEGPHVRSTDVLSTDVRTIEFLMPTPVLAPAAAPVLHLAPVLWLFSSTNGCGNVLK